MNLFGKRGALQEQLDTLNRVVDAQESAIDLYRKENQSLRKVNADLGVSIEYQAEEYEHLLKEKEEETKYLVKKYVDRAVNRSGIMTLRSAASELCKEADCASYDEEPGLRDAASILINVAERLEVEYDGK